MIKRSSMAMRVEAVPDAHPYLHLSYLHLSYQRCGKQTRRGKRCTEQSRVLIDAPPGGPDGGAEVERPSTFANGLDFAVGRMAPVLHVDVEPQICRQTNGSGAGGLAPERSKRQRATKMHAG
jgi:hypothetical protein